MAKSKPREAGETSPKTSGKAQRYVIEPGEPDDPTVPFPSSGDPDAMLEEEHSPPEDGGVAQHPLHDSDLEDRGPEDFEAEISRRDEIIPELRPDARDDEVPSER